MHGQNNYPKSSFSNLKTSQFILNFKARVIVFKLNHTQVMNFFLESYLHNNLIMSFGNACLEVSNVSTSPIAICFGYQSNLKKLITKA
jgi:hypothetical protein